MTAPEKRPDGGFAAFVLDQLAGLNGVSSRAMFGGRGLYFKGLFFGILFRGRVYFKTGPENRDDYRGMPSFRPNARQTLKNYYEVPARGGGRGGRAASLGGQGGARPALGLRRGQAFFAACQWASRSASGVSLSVLPVLATSFSMW